MQNRSVGHVFKSLRSLYSGTVLDGVFVVKEIYATSQRGVLLSSYQRI